MTFTRTTYRACYFVAADGQSDVCLTSEDDAALPEAELIEAAVAEAHKAGLIGDEAPRITETALRDGLHIGDYTS